MFSFNYVESFEPLIVIDFPEAAYDSNKELHDIQMRPGVAKSAVEDILTHTDPVFLGPGANLLGLPVISVKQQFSRKKAATLGIPQVSKYFDPGAPSPLLFFVFQLMTIWVIVSSTPCGEYARTITRLGAFNPEEQSYRYVPSGHASTGIHRSWARVCRGLSARRLCPGWWRLDFG